MSTEDEDEAAALARRERAFQTALASIRDENRFAPVRTEAQKTRDAEVFAWAMRVAGGQP